MASVQATGVVTDDATLRNYAAWVAARQTTADPHRLDVRTEPKYEIPSGAVYDGAWCRPQNDGPGLRALALLRFSRKLLAGSAAADADYVRDNLWPTISRDLAYLVAGGWASQTCDLWEEVRSDDFLWNGVTAKKALEEGAVFAEQLHNASAAGSYRSTAEAIAQRLPAHYQGFITESADRKLDGAVIVALNNGFDDPKPVFSPADVAVADTVRAYNEAFCAEYPINTADSADGVPGVLYGRYAGDTYAGGNPWILTSAALAQLLYRVAHAVAMGKGPDAGAMKVWAEALGVKSAVADANGIDFT